MTSAGPLLAGDSPEAVAIDVGDETWTFRRLSAAIDTLTRGLHDAGIRSGDLVAVLVTAGPEAVALMFAMLQRGIVFTWLDPEVPAARHLAVIQDCAPTCLITDEENAKGETVSRARDRGVCVVVMTGLLFSVSGPPSRRSTPLPPGTACVLYTSGSQGRPKGILQSARNIVQFVDWFAGAFAIEPGARVLRWASFAYDAVFAEVLAAPAAGATVVLPHYRRSDPAATVAVLDRFAVTHLQCVPSFARELLGLVRARGTVPGSLRTVLLSGEVLYPDVVRSARELLPDVFLVNLYGPTETILATWHPVAAGDARSERIPVGRAIPGREVTVVGEDGHPCAPGQVGEIVIAGNHLGLGYLGDRETGFVRRADGTAEFHTVDSGLLRSDGALEFVGRLDDQVKVRGNRVSPADVEATMLDDPAVRAAAVAAEVVAGETALVAFAVAPGASPAALRRRLADRLPSFMVPREVVLVPQLPRLVSGTVDRGALGRTARRPADGGPTPPSGSAGVLSAAWSAALGRSEVAPDDDFFELGGDSLNAAKVIVRVAEALGVELPMEVFLDAPVFRERARRLAMAVEERA